MTLNKRKLRRWAESMFIKLSAQEEQCILERFGTEPEPYEWSEQDIVVQIRNFLSCGEFVKSIQDNSSGQPAFQSDDDF